MNVFFNDSNQTQLSHIVNLYGLGDEVNSKQASEPTAISFTDLAYPEKMLYPINTPFATKLAYCYASEDDTIPADTKNRVIATIKQAADFWGIDLPARKQEAAKPAPYEIKVAYEDAPEDLAPVRNATELKSICDYVSKKASELSYDARRQIAEGVLNAPKELRSLLSREDIARMQKTAGEMFISPENIRIALKIRAEYIEGSGLKAISDMIKTASDNVGATVYKKSDVISILQALHYADKYASLDRMYDSGHLPLPENSLSGVAKIDVEAFCDNVVALKTGSMITKSDIGIKRDAINKFFTNYEGVDTSSMSVNDLTTKIASMPVEDATAFEEIVG